MSAHAAELAVHEHKDYTGAKIGMWMFLFTEVLLFGGLFLLYAVYRAEYPQGFHQGGLHLDVFLGAINTIILLTSSLTMALSIAAIQRGQKGLAIFFLSFTILCGATFMVNKYFEWSKKIHHKIYPGSEALAKYVDNMVEEGKVPPQQKSGVLLFFSLYYLMTGLHGLHVLVGMIAMAFILRKLLKQPFVHHRWNPFQKQELQGCRLVLEDPNGQTIWKSETFDETVKHVDVEFQYYPAPKHVHPDDYVALENTGLYWHLVDLIWIFLFPLFYLIS
ncbi:MAG: cytochrome c oxidase subunit 3 family protein [Planctomycetota bacterium]|nr:MAG: cytochrome c oxidase subunit 3 family protein [Planctomycetota bacterium]